ncbi:PAS domain S-box-containing protein [Azospirillum fermentarium]|uniref:PAS domain-containing sensor histidine kinase n=1 Tax=Azospirillum fermentarium TaxID=1233114 RepID=UPI002226D371|nr:PAS domain-containing sensor histidine kinase [Azospirillum fermentarium]MCW2246465.1 PAS domain S-box-containing protein [Azospirillum fermentarium]
MGAQNPPVEWASVFAESPVALCIVGPGGGVVAANAAFAALTGRDEGAMAGRPLDILMPFDGAAGDAPLPDLPQAGKGAAFLLRPDGEQRDVTYTVAPLPDGNRVVTLADVTDDRCFICKVFSSRDKFRTAIDDQSELIVRFLPDLSVTLANREFAGLWGVVPRDLIGEPVTDYLPPDSVRGTQAFVRSATPADPSQSSEEAWPQPDGTTRWVTWRRLALFGRDGVLTAVQTVGRDTTARRRAEDERVRLAGMVNRSPVVGLAWRMTGDWPVDYVTENAGRCLHLNRTALREGRVGVRGLIHPESRAAFVAWAEACPPAGGLWQTAVRLLPHDGRERWVSVSAWWAGEGRMEAVMLDITEQRTASQALSERKRRFRAIFDHVASFIGLLDTDGVLLEANVTSLRHIGKNPEEVCGRPFWETPWWTHDPAAQMRLKAGIARAAAGQMVRFETTHPGPDGRRMSVDFSLRPIFDDNGAVVLIVPEGHDITDLKATEAALVAAKREAEAANRSKTHFLAVVSHELRTPLNAILGYSEVMEAEMFGPVGNDRYRGYVGAIHSSGRHLLGLIDDILEVSRIELGVLTLTDEMVDVAELLARTGHILSNRAADAGVVLGIETVPGLPRLRCDIRRVMQMLVNVGYNSIKFTPAGGTVRVHAAFDPGRGLTITVADTGAGIPAEDLDRVWEPFSQAGSPDVRAAGGVGLGLTITRALMEAHEGTIALSSAVGQGTTVTLTFPAFRCVAHGGPAPA